MPLNYLDVLFSCVSSQRTQTEFPHGWKLDFCWVHWVQMECTAVTSRRAGGPVCDWVGLCSDYTSSVVRWRGKRSCDIPVCLRLRRNRANSQNGRNSCEVSGETLICNFTHLFGQIRLLLSYSVCCQGKQPKIYGLKEFHLQSIAEWILPKSFLRPRKFCTNVRSLDLTLGNKISVLPWCDGLLKMVGKYSWEILKNELNFR